MRSSIFSARPVSPLSRARSQLAIITRTSWVVPWNSPMALLMAASASGARLRCPSTCAYSRYTVARSCVEMGIAFFLRAASACCGVIAVRTPGILSAASSSLSPPSKSSSSTLHCALMMLYSGLSRTAKLLAMALSSAFWALRWLPLDRWIWDSIRWASAHPSSRRRMALAVRAAASCSPATYRVRMSSSCAGMRPGARRHTASSSASAFSMPALFASDLSMGSPLS
mmetsp:Transcript_7626/g.19427  ORF Transcript_7626/g.19427 Transcript_7626/m.19427 type:complete len:227 (-) Transcript_7626:1034-1714(-)